MNKRPLPTANPGPSEPVLKRLRKRDAPPTLRSLTVEWSPEDNEPDKISFHIVTEAKLTGASSNTFRIVQYISDGWNVEPGTHLPAGKLPYYTTQFIEDEDACFASNSSSVAYDDKPGFDENFGLQGDSNIKYVFGAYWEVYLGDTLLVRTTPLFGSITGKHTLLHHRTFTPSARVTAQWNIAQGHWEHQGALVNSFPAWGGTYPQPPVDNS